MRDHGSCKERVRSCAEEISSVERVAQKAKGEASEVRAAPGRERASAQIDSGAIDADGPKTMTKRST